MYPQSIFELARKKEDLISANQGMANLYYDEIAPLRNIIDSGANNNKFGNSLISFRWHPASGSWWIPSRSYFRIDCSLTAPDGVTPLRMDDRIALNMGAGSCLFSKMQYKINDKTISEISEHCAQVDAIKTRLRYSGEWLETTGQNLNSWSSDIQTRMRAICQNGHYDSNTNNYTRLGTLETLAGVPNLTVGADSIEFVYAHTVSESAFLFTDAAVVSRILFGNSGNAAAHEVADDDSVFLNIKKGDAISYVIDGSTYVGTITRIRSAGTGGGNGNTDNQIIITRHQNNIVLDDVGAVLINLSEGNGEIQMGKVLNKENVKSKQSKKFSLIYVPPLSIFGYNKAIPGSSKHEIDLVPFSETIYQKNIIESLLTDKVHTTNGANNDYRFKVDNMLFYAARCDGPVVEQDEFYLELDECRAQATTITNASRSQYSLDISPSTHALTVCFQDQAAENSTLYSQSKFRIRNNEELNLTNFYVRYAGIQKPQPDFRPEYKERGDVGDEANSNIDRITEQYARSIMYNGAYYDSSGERITDWKRRGFFMHWPWPKTGTDRETRVYVSTQFSSLSSTPRLFLFNHFNKVCILRYQNGSLSQVLVNEV